MPEARARAPLALAAVVALLFLAMPGPAFGRGASDVVAPAIHDAAVPGDVRCADQSPDPERRPKVCPQPILSAGILLPVVGVVVAGGALVLVAAYLVLRRRASQPLLPADPGEWWVCPKCGSTNVVGSARCYACGTWQR